MSRNVRPQQRCAGVDGCKGGWVVASRDGAHVEPSIANVIATFDIVGIDMPIGLPNIFSRQSDFEARRYLRPRGSTVFPTPPRACIDATDYSQACELAREATGKAISIQAWNIVPKIKEVDALISRDHERRVAEMHPECSFLAMNNDEALASKHTSVGIEQRSKLVESHFGVTPIALRFARIDDVLDAYAVLWSAERFAAGTHRTMPEHDEQRDARGLLMRIVI
jgi:predicted RNase H-like nuclease